MHPTRTRCRQPRVPIAIAAGGPKALALVAKYGDAWITFGDTSEQSPSAEATEASVRRQMRQLEDACAAIGRDPSTIQRIYLVGNTEERPLASTSAFDDFVGRYSAIGFTDLVLHHPRADDPAWDEPESIIDEIATDVLPKWRVVSAPKPRPLLVGPARLTRVICCEQAELVGRPF